MKYKFLIKNDKTHSGKTIPHSFFSFPYPLFNFLSLFILLPVLIFVLAANIIFMYIYKHTFRFKLITISVSGQYYLKNKTFCYSIGTQCTYYIHSICHNYSYYFSINDDKR